MNTCSWIRKVDAYFDRELAPEADIEAHLAECEACAAHLAHLEAQRKGVASALRREHIQDGQFPAFMAGIHAGIDRQPAPWRGLMAMASVTVAAFIVAIAAFALFGGGAEPVQGTVLEEASTELEGATVDWYESPEGVTTVWVTVSKDDVW